MKKFLYAVAFQVFLWLFWWAGAFRGGTKDFSVALSDPSRFWAAGILFPVVFGGWVCLVRLQERPSERIVATVFPGWSVVYWVWLPFAVELVAVWFWLEAH